MLAAVGVFVALWIGVRAVAAADHLRQAEAAAGRITEVLADGDGDISGAVDDLVDHSAAARSLTDDIIWRGAEVLPWVGPQLQAVGTLAEGVDVLAQDVLLPLSSVVQGGGVEAFLPKDGRIPLEMLEEIAVVAPSAHLAADRVTTLLDDVDTAPLLGLLRREFERAEQSVATVQELVAVVDTAGRLLPPMLGADGPRDYLVVVQNNAELRSLGGMPGALSHLRADDGRLTLVEQFTARDFAVDDPVGGLSPELADLYQGPDRVISAVTAIPEFATSAGLIQRYWTAVKGAPLDGVITLDPVALSYLLRATGPLTLPDGTTLGETSAVPALLHEVYLDRPAAQQDALFAAAAAEMFAVVTAGRFDGSILVAALGQAVDEHRLMLWSADEELQRTLEESGLSGSLPGPGEFGVYLNDGTGSKMDYFLDATAEIDFDASDPTRAELVLRLTNDAPADVASLPAGVTGGGNYGVPPGIIRTVVYLYLPQGSVASSLSAEGFSPFRRGTHAGHEVLVTWVDLAPGASAVARIVTPVPDAGAATIRMTPQAS